MTQVLQWREREPPLAAEGVFAEGSTALALLDRLLEAQDSLASMRFVGDRKQLCVLGEASRLPWVDGVVYIAPEPGLSEIWLPCFTQASVDPSLLLRLLPTLGLSAPVALLPQLGTALSLSAARSLGAEALQGFRAALKANL